MNKMAKTEDVSLKTLQVEICALKLNNKQVTVSLFKQIPEADIFSSDFLYLGLPWGRINYFWAGNKVCDRHILWEAGGELYRYAYKKSSVYYHSEHNNYWAFSDSKEGELIKEVERVRNYAGKDRARALIQDNESAYSEALALRAEAKAQDKLMQAMIKSKLEELDRLPQLFIAA